MNAITTKIQSSCLEMNAQELGNALYGLQDMTSDYPEVRLTPPLKQCPVIAALDDDDDDDDGDGADDGDDDDETDAAFLYNNWQLSRINFSIDSVNTKN